MIKLRFHSSITFRIPKEGGVGEEMEGDASVQEVLHVYEGKTYEHELRLTTDSYGDEYYH